VGIGLTIKLVNIPDNRVMGVNGLADEVTEGTIMSESANEKRWYVIHAYSGYERKVKLALEERIDLSGLQDSFGEVLVPTEEVLEMRGGQKRKSERKFFPGYVLLQMVLNDDSWHLVKDTPRVMGFIGGTAEKPAPISQREVDEIMNRLEETVDKPSHKTIYEPGELVRVTDGPFNDFTGTVEEVNYEKSRVRVAVSIFGRSTPVELEFAQVEKG
jgi:transcriptional antiterminator NusG